MSWRTLVIQTEAKLSLRMGHLIIQKDEPRDIPLEDIDILLIENQACLITGPLLNALASHKITTILCDAHHQPSTVVQALYGHHRQAKKIPIQISWLQKRKERLWQLVIQHKITMQQDVLSMFDPASNSLQDHIAAVQLNDQTNREGHAAKIYWHELFNKEFTRGKEDVLNYGLNYGYGILLAIVSRVIVSKGYLTELGINHCNEYNPYNLACDFMEVFRPIVDQYVKQVIDNEFGSSERLAITQFVNHQVLIKKRRHYLSRAIDIYIESMTKYLQTGDETVLEFPRMSVESE